MRSLTQKEFKAKLDNRQFWGDNSIEMWDAAYSWLVKANSNTSLCKWSWDCGLKLDYDGELCRISSRFYPPHKHSIDYNMYSGSVSVYIGGNKIHQYEVEASSLDSLKEIVEGYATFRGFA